MRLLRIVSFLAALSLLCLLGFSSVFPSLDVSADSDIITLSGFQTAQMLGVSIEAYYLGTDMQYHRRDLSLVDTSRTFISSNLPSDHPLKELEGHAVCFYSVVNPDDLYDNSGVVTDTSQSPLWLVSWNVQLENVTHFVGGCSSIHYSRYFDYPLSSLRMYNYFTGGQYSSSVHPVDAGTSAGVANSASFTYVSGSGSIVGDSYDGDAITYYIGDSAFSSVNPHYAGNDTYFYFIAPSINSDYVFSGSSSPPDPPSDPDYSSSGTVTGTIVDNGDGTQNINITVENDNSGLIGGILDGFRNLFRSLFVPDEDFMNDWQADLRDDFNEHLGAAAEVVDLMDEHADYLRNAVATETIYFPGVSFPDGRGVVHQLIAPQDVELQPMKEGRMRPLYTAAALAVDLVCLFAVFNMLQDKYEIFLNPDAEVINYDN